MTTPTLSSTPVLRTVLVWSLAAGGVILAAAAAIGAATAGGAGAASGAVGALVGIVFPALTVVSILVGGRFYGRPGWLQLFFGIVLGGWLLKFLIVAVALAVLVRVEWVQPVVFFFALLATAIASLVVDVVVVSRMRMPTVSDTVLPTTDPDDELRPTRDV